MISQLIYQRFHSKDNKGGSSMSVTNPQLKRRYEAGMNAVIPMPLGKGIELTPEQYIEYKETGKTGAYKPSKDAIRHRISRSKKKELKEYRK